MIEPIEVYTIGRTRFGHFVVPYARRAVAAMPVTVGSWAWAPGYAFAARGPRLASQAMNLHAPLDSMWWPLLPPIYARAAIGPQLTVIDAQRLQNAGVSMRSARQCLTSGVGADARATRWPGSSR